MQKCICLLLTTMLIGATVFAQPEKSVYSPSQKRQARETAEMNRHYNEIKPRGSSGSSGPISGDYDSYGGADYSNMKGINEADARQKAIVKEYNAKEQKLSKIIAEKKIEKTKEHYQRLIGAAIEAGFNMYWATRTFGDDAEQFDSYIHNPKYYGHSFFKAESTTIIGSGSAPKYTPVFHDTKYGSGNEGHPVSFKDISVSHQNNGYKKFESISTFIKAIIDDGPNNFNTITDKTTQRSYSICRCDFSYGLKYYWRDFEALENGAFKSNGDDVWKYPYINFETTGRSLEEYTLLFDQSVNELLATKMYVNSDEKNFSNKYAQLTIKKEFQQDPAIDYFVTMRVQEDNGKAYFIMKLYKRDAEVQDNVIVNTKPTLKGVKLNIPANGTAAIKVKIVNSKEIYTTINEVANCLDWSWASEQQKLACGKKGWGTFKPKNGDVGELISASKHCFTNDRVVIVKIGDYYVPVNDGALVFED